MYILNVYLKYVIYSVYITYLIYITYLYYKYVCLSFIYCPYWEKLS